MIDIFAAGPKDDFLYAHLVIILHYSQNCTQGQQACSVFLPDESECCNVHDLLQVAEMD